MQTCTKVHWTDRSRVWSHATGPPVGATCPCSSHALYLASAPELNSNLGLSNFYLHSVCLVWFVLLDVRLVSDGWPQEVRFRLGAVSRPFYSFTSCSAHLWLDPCIYPYILCLYISNTYTDRLQYRPSPCPAPCPTPLSAQNGAQYSTAIGTQVKGVQMLSTPRIPTAPQIKSKASRSVSFWRRHPPSLSLG